MNKILPTPAYLNNIVGHVIEDDLVTEMIALGKKEGVLPGTQEFDDMITFYNRTFGSYLI